MQAFLGGFACRVGRLWRVCGLVGAFCGGGGIGLRYRGSGILLLECIGTRTCVSALIIEYVY